jgi:hypothetical protein
MRIRGLRIVAVGVWTEQSRHVSAVGRHARAFVKAAGLANVASALRDGRPAGALRARLARERCIGMMHAGGELRTS